MTDNLHFRSLGGAGLLIILALMAAGCPVGSRYLPSNPSGEFSVFINSDLSLEKTDSISVFLVNNRGVDMGFGNIKQFYLDRDNIALSFEASLPSKEFVIINLDSGHVLTTDRAGAIRSLGNHIFELQDIAELASHQNVRSLESERYYIGRD